MGYFFRKAIPIFIIFLISGLVFFGYNYATERLELHLSNFSEENFNAKLSIGCVSLGLSLCLELKDVKIGESINVRSVRIYPNPAPFLFKNRIIVSTVKIIDPVVKIGSTEGRQFAIPDFLKKEGEGISFRTSASNFYFSKIRIRNGTLICSDGKENALEFVRLKGTLEKPGIYFSKDNDIQFVVMGFLKNKDSDFLSPLRIDGCMESDGVIKTHLQCSDIKVDAFGPIYKKYLSGIIERGRLDFKSDIQITKHSLIARCSVEGEDIALRKDLNRKIDMPFVASFIALFSFKNKVIKIKDLQGNFLNFIFDR